MNGPAETPPRRGAVASRRFAVAAMVIAVFAAILELTARFVVFGTAGIDPRLIVRMGHPRDVVTLETTPSIAFEYKPNLDRALLLNRFRTNSWGMRDEEYPLAKAPETFRVAVIGSSFTVPAGVEIEQAYHSVLERRLSAALAPIRYEFLSFAVGRHIPSQYLAMIEQRALRFEPDLILVAASPLAVPYFLKDWNRPTNPDVLDRRPAKFRSTFFAVAKSRLGIDRREIPTPQNLSRPAVKATVVRKLGELSRRTRVPIVVARLELQAKPPEPIDRRLERSVRKHGLLYLDTRSAFAGSDPRDYWIHELDPHPNALAHTIFADVIEDFLRREGLLEYRTPRR